ncbi:hypothetical protein [[Clostridium] dakarense]|uniref:hypothetical protein n=1 Tax=Faecalimicrobium dakarense TaxID=1301100 RepID=UPI0011CC8BE3|nr:hypothetical protein [[Clostridium] dakarense]
MCRKSVNYRRSSKKKVSSRIDLYCKEAELPDRFWIYFTIIMMVDYSLDFKYILENFSKVPFKEQSLFIVDINSVIWILCLLIMLIYSKASSRKGILYKEGLILDDGKFYSFESIKSYNFKSSFRGTKYRDLVLKYDNKTFKRMYIYNEDIDKFKTLLDKNKAI